MQIVCHQRLTFFISFVVVAYINLFAHIFLSFCEMMQQSEVIYIIKEYLHISLVSNVVSTLQLQCDTMELEHRLHTIQGRQFGVR